MEIYLIINLINGKQYVGQTIYTAEQRFKQHLRGDLYIDKAIRKYGVENFKLEVLCRCRTKEKLNEKERYWAKKLNTYVPNGYNVAECGEFKTYNRNIVDHDLVTFEEFVEEQFHKDYDYNPRWIPIKVWEPDLDQFCIEDPEECWKILFEYGEYWVPPESYYTQVGEPSYFRSINQGHRLSLIPVHVLQESINTHTPQKYKDLLLFDTHVADGIKWICADYTTPELYEQYIVDNKDLLINHRLSAYSRLYEQFKANDYNIHNVI